MNVQRNSTRLPRQETTTKRSLLQAVAMSSIFQSFSVGKKSDLSRSLEKQSCWYDKGSKNVDANTLSHLMERPHNECVDNIPHRRHHSEHRTQYPTLLPRWKLWVKYERPCVCLADGWHPSFLSGYRVVRNEEYLELFGRIYLNDDLSLVFVQTTFSE